MRVAVHQPNYAPWCGYFAKMLVSDVFVFFDDVQLPQGRSFVSRVKIAKGEDGERWLTVPISKSGSLTIDRVRLADPRFADRHLAILRQTYARTPYLEEVLDLISPVYERADGRLASFNIDLITTVADYLGWNGKFFLSSDWPADLKADARIADLVAKVGGSTYVSGAGGENYQSVQTYADQNVHLEVREFRPVVYDRSGWSWIPGLSCLDALFHQGRAAREAMVYVNGDS